MARKEATTDLWVASLLNESRVEYDAQGSHILDIDTALKTASKRGTGNSGYPEYVAKVKDFILVIEDKRSLDKHVKKLDSGLIDVDKKAVTDYAVNGAYFYAKHIAQNSPFKKIFAIGISGDEKHHRITPLYVDDRESYLELDDIDTLVSFSEDNIDEYYTRNVLKQKTDSEKTLQELLGDAKELHEHLRNYGSLKETDKPIVVAGIFLALDEIKNKGFSIDSLTGDDIKDNRDGDKIMTAIKSRFRRSNVGPEIKKDKLLHEFQIIQNSFLLNEVNETLGMTPLRYYTQFLYDKIFKQIKYSSEDYIGRFYGEFIRYSGGDGQSLGIVLTPRHICDLMCDLVDVKANDVVLDPCCGTGGFLISAMHRMLSPANSDPEKRNIKKKQIHGIEIQPNMFTLAATNMIIRQDGNSNIECCDFLKRDAAELQLKGATVGLMNPPYSQGSAKNPGLYEIAFVEHLLDSLTEGARCAVIIPQSSVTGGKSNDEKNYKRQILAHHTLEGVITCNTDTFYGIGVNPVIVVFTAHEPHCKDKLCKFIDFREDGYAVSAHVGLLEGPNAKDKRQYLLDVWNGKTQASSKFCVESTVDPDDEWLHSFYYFNDEIPTEVEFEKSVGDYMTFEFSMIMQNREYLFDRGEQ